MRDCPSRAARSGSSRSGFTTGHLLRQPEPVAFGAAHAMTHGKAIAAQNHEPRSPERTQPIYRADYCRGAFGAAADQKSGAQSEGQSHVHTAVDCDGGHGDYALFDSDAGLLWIGIYVAAAVAGAGVGFLTAHHQEFALDYETGTIT